ncbi:expansin EXLX1 family cellulose-binding protein [Nocardia sp. NBC_01327]|uniref:expansin EXLX1 family cellulose-binding protein n=1 Tax=Nocardia sp. NBC_01327 TaxID=2903593 RepID=UPI002E16425B|nr:expansin EXLX1 family cellulose-binding protein [Nocardia sp. NBC_01327]
MHRTGYEVVRSSRPWLWTALAAAVVVGTITWVMRPEPVACRSAAPITTVITEPAPTTPSSVTTQQLPPSPPPPQIAQARFYAFSPGVACSLPDLPLDGYYVGVPTSEYADSSPCGTYVNIDGPLGSVRAQIVDRCPGCAPHQYDLSRAAFEAIANSTDGVAQIKISQVVDPDPAPELFYRVQQGSSADWIGMLFSGGGNSLRAVDLHSDAGGDWKPLHRGYDNYWTISGAGPGPFTARVTDVYGHTVEVPGITVTPGQLRYTGIRLYDPDPPPVTTVAAPPPPVVVTTVVPAPSHCNS